MAALYLYSLLPLLAVSLLLFFTALLHGSGARGLVVYTLSIAFWVGTLLLAFLPQTAELGQRLVASGTFVAAAFLHAAYDFVRARRYGLVWAAYAVAWFLFLFAAVRPGLLYDPLSLTAGPFFWHSIALAVVAATVPLWRLQREWRRAEAPRRRQLLSLGAAGAVSYLGAWSNALLLAHGVLSPIGLYLVLASLFILAYVVRDQQPAAERRLLDRSMLYSAIAALLSAGFLFGVLALMQHSGEPVTVEYGLSTFFLLAMAALAFEPLRQRLQERIGRTLIPSRAGAVDLARELVQQERRADHAERLAEIGALTSAVAHEVRNPLGVLQIHLSRLARQGADPETLAQMREQIRRAERFVEDLLRYGRPAALELREVRLDATIALAWSTARQGLGQAAPDPVDFECDAPEQPCIEADQAQLLQTFVVLFENALLALRECEVRRVRVHAGARGEHMEIRVEDSGPGIPEPIRGRIFEPFVTGRKREGPRPGTGLGLAIARRIVERHGGEIRASRSETLGGARFDLVLPLRQQILAAAAGAA